jgi:hypothetical protein
VSWDLLALQGNGKMERPTSRNYSQNDLFRGEDSHFQLNACVGTNGGPWRLFDYAYGYFHAAELIAEALQVSSARVDVTIYPLGYAYRHAIELSLKSLTEKLPRIWLGTINLRPSHKLIDNWHAIKPYLQRDKGFDDDNTLIPLIERILTDFLEVDPYGEAFRYPNSKDGTMYLQKYSVINVVVLYHAMKTVREVFDWWDTCADTLWDGRVAEMT